jgi:hypothetical protein
MALAYEAGDTERKRAKNELGGARVGAHAANA